MSKWGDAILDEQRFPYENMSLEERNNYLNIVKNCKDICDSKYKIGGISQCQIVELSFIKLKKVDEQDNIEVKINGSLSIGNDEINENRTIEGLISISDKSVIVEYNITRIIQGSNPIEYTVIDEFKLVGDKLKRNSYYEGDSKSTRVVIKIDDMKGKSK